MNSVCHMRLWNVLINDLMVFGPASCKLSARFHPHLFYSFFLSLFHLPQSLLLSLPLFCLTPFSRCCFGRALRWRVGESLCVSEWFSASSLCSFLYLSFVSMSSLNQEFIWLLYGWFLYRFSDKSLIPLNKLFKRWRLGGGTYGGGSQAVELWWRWSWQLG